MLLYLIRHGIAIDRAHPDCPPDPSRKLTDEGIRKTREVGFGLDALGVQPTHVFSSPYIRARQTADLVCEAMDFPTDEITETDTLEPCEEPEDIFGVLQTVLPKRPHGQASIFLVGHAPNLDDVLSYALGVRRPISRLKKAAVAAIELYGLNPPRGSLVWLMQPKALRQLGKHHDD